jgi:putative oxidoreductase
MRWTRNDVTAATYAIMRFMVGWNFATHGAQKLFGVLAVPNMPGFPHTPKFMLAGIIEFFGGLLVAIGLGTTPAAFIASGEMAVAYFTVHAKQGFWPILNNGEKPVLFCFVFLFIAAYGGGRFSVDALLRRRRAADELPDTAGMLTRG